MKSDLLRRRTCYILLIALAVGLAAWAGYNQTNPNHHAHSILDDSGRMVHFKAKLRIGWRGSESQLDQVKYELENTGSLTFEVYKVSIVSKSNGSVLWSSGDSKVIKGGKKGSREWRGDYMHRKNIPHSNIKMKLKLSSGGKNSTLVWDPSIGGSASTWIE